LFVVRQESGEEIMLKFKTIIKLGVRSLAAGVASFSAFATPITNISGTDSGHIQFPISEAAIAFRPRTAAENSLLIDNYYIHDLTNQKGLDIRASTQGSAPAWAYQTITIENSNFKNINRREDLPGGNGLHIDHIRIAGGGNNQDNKINILIENVTIDGGDALPILITDGTYGTVTLRNVTIKNTTLNNVQFKTDNVGSVDKIVIDNSPGLGVALIGRPGSIGEVLVRNSPNVRLGDSLNATGRTGATISYIDAASDSGIASEATSSGLHMTPAVPNAVQFETTVTLPAAAAIPEPGSTAIILSAIGLLMVRRPKHGPLS
jgi:hypothetical protein